MGSSSQQVGGQRAFSATMVKDDSYLFDIFAVGLHLAGKFHYQSITLSVM